MLRSRTGYAASRGIIPGRSLVPELELFRLVARKKASSMLGGRSSRRTSLTPFLLENGCHCFDEARRPSTWTDVPKSEAPKAACNEEKPLSQGQSDTSTVPPYSCFRVPGGALETDVSREHESQFITSLSSSKWWVVITWSRHRQKVRQGTSRNRAYPRNPYRLSAHPE
jgi:hypothetical protein